MMKEAVPDALRLDVQDGIGRIIIDRPERRNAVTLAMWRALPGLIDTAVKADARVIIFSGAGDDFSAGADIGEFDTVRRDAETARAYEEANSRAFAAIREAPVPVIAAIRGICFGGGFGLAAAADLRLASTTSRFAVPAARLGLAYPGDAVQDIVRALGPAMAAKTLYTASAFGPQDALACGMILSVESDDALDGEAARLATAIAAAAPLSVRASKAALAASLTNAPERASLARQLGDATFESHDYQEGRNAFRERRQPVFTGR